MRDLVIPPHILDAIGTIATLLGIILAFDAIAQSIVAHQSVGWGIFGVFVTGISALSIADRVFACFGDPAKEDERPQRVIGGGMAVFLFLIFAALWGLFRFKT